jgi:hypothetical protein
MPELNLSTSLFGRPIKPVSLVLMMTMLLLGIYSILNIGVLGASQWGDVIGGMAFGVAGLSVIAWWKNSQSMAEYALLSAFFIWGFRFWGIVLVQGWDAFKLEGWYLSIMWVILSGGSWLLERSDPNAIVKNRGGKWTPH